MNHSRFASPLLSSNEVDLLRYLLYQLLILYCSPYDSEHFLSLNQVLQQHECEFNYFINLTITSV